VVSVPKIWEVYLLMTSARRSLCCAVGLIWFVWFMDLISFLLLSRGVCSLACFVFGQVARFDSVSLTRGISLKVVNIVSLEEYLLHHV
jgi:hypothetical protein